MPKIFCGVGNVPKKSRLGTAKECVEKKQVRHYGIEKIDKALLVKTKNSIPVTRDKLISELSKERGNIDRYKGRYNNAPKGIDKEKLDEYKKKWKAAEKRYAKLVVQFNIVEKERDADKKKEKSKTPKKKTKSK